MSGAPLLCFVLLIKVNVLMAHQCYVCGPTKLPCEDFNPNNKSFIEECDKWQGCSIRTYSKFIERACETISLRDCKIANNIKYCYCTENLCNGKTIKFSDDEDMIDEGSGISVITNSGTTELIQEKINKSLPSRAVTFCISTILIPVFLGLLR